jgi:membrane associated rhomboid family serine protease
VYRNYRGFKSSLIWILIGINLLFFIVTSIEFDVILSLGLIPEIVLDRPWTIITSIFLHGGFGHILANMFTLYFFGSYLCTLIGEKRFLIVYLVGGILGNILYIILGEPISIAIGASGAVFAVGGALTVLTPKLRVFVFPIPAPLPLWVAVIGGFLIVSFFPNVAWQAHLGGLAFGLITGYFFRKRQRFYY